MNDCQNHYSRAGTAYRLPPRTVHICPESEHTPTRFSKDPAIWGPGLWYQLHNRSCSYAEKPTVNDVDEMRNYIVSMPAMLPCSNCESHAKSYISNTNTNGSLEKAVSDRLLLIRYFVDFHNDVNHRKGKPKVCPRRVTTMFANGTVTYPLPLLSDPV